jgi:hypothetical protein
MAARSSPSRFAFASGVLDDLPGPRRLEGYVRTDTLIEWSLAVASPLRPNDVLAVVRDSRR